MNRFIFSKKSGARAFLRYGRPVYATPNVQFDAVFGTRLNDPRGPLHYQRPEKPAPVKKLLDWLVSWRPTRTSNCTLGVA